MSLCVALYTLIGGRAAVREQLLGHGFQAGRGHKGMMQLATTLRTCLDRVFRPMTRGFFRGGRLAMRAALLRCYRRCQKEARKNDCENTAIHPTSLTRLSRKVAAQDGGVIICEDANDFLGEISCICHRGIGVATVISVAALFDVFPKNPIQVAALAPFVYLCLIVEPDLI